MTRSLGRTLPAGDAELVDGIHRWAVATDFNIGLVPVKMTIEVAESPFAW